MRDLIRVALAMERPSLFLYSDPDPAYWDDEVTEVHHAAYVSEKPPEEESNLRRVAKSHHYRWWPEAL